MRVPLSPLAVSITQEIIAAPKRPKNSRFVFNMTSDTPLSGYAQAKRRPDRLIHEYRIEKSQGVPLVAMLHGTIDDLRTTFSTLAKNVPDADIAVADRILNHVATAVTSRLMRIRHMSELFEPRNNVLREWAELIEREVGSRTHRAASVV